LAKHLVIGGSGFIGSNLVARLLVRDEPVTIFDNLSRPGVEVNLQWLRTLARGSCLTFCQGDIRDAEAVRNVSRDADVIYHLAAQTAVTTSVENPREDFEVNAGGTFNVLEAARRSNRDPVFIYASTNKVYGGMEDMDVVEQETRYAYLNRPLGIDETAALDFHSPYGCSKGAGDQYTRDYARIYGLRSVVARQSCIFGPRQFGTEDQGWLAWFFVAAAKNRPMTIYGDGKQVRDLLYVDDLLDFYDLAVENIDRIKGGIYNVGGGPQNSLSVWYELKPHLDRLFHRPISADCAPWRPGDQRIFVSDIRRAAADLGWRPKTDLNEGLAKLHDWVQELLGFPSNEVIHSNSLLTNVHPG
jgi:CDP-paratose 2-epimerase